MLHCSQHLKRHTGECGRGREADVLARDATTMEQGCRAPRTTSALPPAGAAINQQHLDEGSSSTIAALSQQRDVDGSADQDADTDPDADADGNGHAVAGGCCAVTLSPKDQKQGHMQLPDYYYPHHQRHPHAYQQSEMNVPPRSHINSIGTDSSNLQ